MSRGGSGTLTQRVVWALTGTVALFVTALALLAYLTFDQMEDDLVNDILTTEMDRLVQHARVSDEFYLGADRACWPPCAPGCNRTASRRPAFPRNSWAWTMACT